MDSHDRERLIEKLVALVNSKDEFKQISGDDTIYQKFLDLYPADRVSNLSLEEYCLGEGAKKGNFCWWLERGLEPVFGRYMPGTAKGHMLYNHKDGYIYQNQSLADLLPEEALKYTLTIQSAIANADLSDLMWLEDDTELFKRLGLEARVSVSDGRKLRLLCVYHPSEALPITSSEHIAYYLKQLGCPEDQIPKKTMPIRRMLKLKEYFENIRDTHCPGLTPYGFIKALYSDELNLTPKKQVASGANIETQDENELLNQISDESLNQILYGPPGTGKTYETVSLAVKITEPEWYRDTRNELDTSDFISALKDKYDELVNERRIVFTTFHQSFSYEDFIEGIRASTNPDTAQIQYVVEDGIFKELCKNATAKTVSSGDSVNVSTKRVWKMSLGNTLISQEDTIYQECLDNSYILLGWGQDINFSGCENRAEIRKKLQESSDSAVDNNSYELTSVHNFKNVIKSGDLVIISDGNHRFRAIGEVTGDYQWLAADDRAEFHQMRPVKWLRQYEPSLSKEKLINKAFSQMTLYELKKPTLDIDKLASLVSKGEAHSEEPKPHVMIIDEINRGNISRIFGELITLLEPSKRIGQSDMRSAKLPYSKSEFSVPSNIHVIGTMNTADKSLSQIDLALRRRFEFIEMPPIPSLLADTKVYGVEVADILSTMNERIEVLLDKDHLIGHSYFLPLLGLKSEKEKNEKLARIFSANILPLLQEYFFDDWERISWVLNDSVKNKIDRFVIGNANSVEKLFPQRVAEQLNIQRFSINKEAFNRPLSYRQILNDTGEI